MTDRHAPPHHPEDIDRFTRWGEDATGFLEDHWRKLLALVAVLLALGLAWTVYTHRQHGREVAAQEQVASIAKQFPEGSGTIPESSIRDAATRYEKVLADAPDGPARHMAQLYLAQAYEALGEANQARAAYEALRSAPPAFSGPAKLRLGYLAAAGGDLAAAGAAFEQVVQSDPGLAPQAAFELGRLAERADQTEAAIAAYRKVADGYPGTPQASEARTRLKALGVEPEPTPVAPVMTEGAGETPAAEAPAAETGPASAPAEGEGP